MDEVALMIIAAVINGVMLAIGMIIGTRLTASEFEKKASKMLEDSKTAQSLKRLLKKAEDEKLIKKITVFFEEATVLVSSPEAKNFFKNATEIMAELGGSKKVKLKMPEKRGKSK